jgi:carbon-monoxide dehydrogenase medium subunit
MKAFRLLTARDAQHAVALLAEHAPSVAILAGGTDLLVDLKSAPRPPQVVLDLSRAPDLKGIELTAEGLRIGALATFSEIMRSPLVRSRCPVLAKAAHSIGAVQTRNLGTLGGNLVSAVPSMDSGPALMALDALVTLAGPGGRRRHALEDFFVAPRKTRLAPGELLVDIVIPARNLGKPCEFLKFGLRKGQALALVNVAVSLPPARIALGAVAPTVMRARQAEAYLEANQINEEARSEAGRIAAGEARPISDFRASAAYRRELVAVLVRRALTAVCRS